MKIHNVEQGTDEWKALRLGIPTGSSFDKIITSTGKASTQADGYMALLLAEIMTGKPTMTFEKTPWMERGNELEAEAAQFYELQTDLAAVKIGFCTNDDGTIGASPDRLIGDDGLLEIKCPAPHTHVQYLLSGKVDRGYWPQIQGQLFITGRKWCDWMSYNPEMPAVIMRVERDEEFITALDTALKDFLKKLETSRKTLTDRGYIHG